MRTAVLGAGAVGAATAFHPSKLGQNVIAIDRQLAAALEAGFGNGAVIHASRVGSWSNQACCAKYPAGSAARTRRCYSGLAIPD